VRVELTRGAVPDERLADEIRARIRDVLVVSAQVDLVPWGSLARSEYKSVLVERESR
jgi:phenylacetate-CoA ligase